MSIHLVYMITFPNAKINIGLFVTEKRLDGYHNLETIFYPIPLVDKIEATVVDTPESSLRIDGMRIDGNINDNLIMKAYNLLKQSYELPSIEFILEKNIPFGAGLGGGSADAACTLSLLNDSFSLGITLQELERLAAQIGADCPFFIQNKPVFATGIGNEFHPISFSLAGYYLVLVKSPIHVSTPDAFRNIAPKAAPFNLKSINTIPIEEWKHCVINDFEKSVFIQYPDIEMIKYNLYEQGALYASMSGSGSSVFGIFPKQVDITKLFQNCFVWAGFLA